MKSVHSQPFEPRSSRDRSESKTRRLRAAALARGHVRGFESEEISVDYMQIRVKTGAVFSADGSTEGEFCLAVGEGSKKADENNVQSIATFSPCDSVLGGAPCWRHGQARRHSGSVRQLLCGRAQDRQADALHQGLGRAAQEGLSSDAIRQI